MSSDGNVIGGLATRYAVALFELGQELSEAEQQKLQDDTAAFLVALDTSADLQKLIRSPVISADEQGLAMRAVLNKAGVHPLFGNFVALVIEKRRAVALPDIARQYGALVAGARDEMVVHVTAARTLGEGQIDALKEKLEDVFGKTILVDTKEDASLLGGLIVKLGSQMIDGSLRTKLNSLKTALSGS